VTGRLYLPAEIPPYLEADIPLTTALLKLTLEDVVNFHALPLSRRSSLKTSSLAGTYEALFGSRIHEIDVTYSGSVLDNPLLPTRILKRSEEITATAFGADRSLYVTTGTTCANQIVIGSTVSNGTRVLADRSCHQSMHFALHRAQAQLDYVSSAASCGSSGRSYVNIPELIRRYQEAALTADPYRVVVLGGASYEGVLYDLETILDICTEIDDTCLFVIDEAWSSAAGFHPFFVRNVAMQAATAIRKRYPQRAVRVVATQSAHKSLSSLRQGSFIHVRGDEALIAAIELGRFAYHTTSPSYPILASLELARAHAVLEGHAALDGALALADELRSAISLNPELAAYRVNDGAFIAPKDRRFVTLDPLRVSIDLSQSGFEGNAFKEYALRVHRVYVNRVTPTSVLVNVHIGVTRTALQRLLNALAGFIHDVAPNSEEAICRDFVIAYPPGVPLLVPGERMNARSERAIADARSSGASLVRITHQTKTDHHQERIGA
jgi:arginine/lysine/ornithine decarboxylase